MEDCDRHSSYASIDIPCFRKVITFVHYTQILEAEMWVEAAFRSSGCFSLRKSIAFHQNLTHGEWLPNRKASRCWTASFSHSPRRKKSSITMAMTYIGLDLLWLFRPVLLFTIGIQDESVKFWVYQWNLFVQICESYLEIVPRPRTTMFQVRTYSPWNYS